MKIVGALILLNICMLSSLFATAQDGEGISGVVHDSTGAVIAGALVRVGGQNATGAFSTQTDDQGQFLIGVPSEEMFGQRLKPEAGGFALTNPSLTLSVLPDPRIWILC